MNEGDQAKDNLEVEWVDTELCIYNGLWNCTFASDNAPEKQGLDSLQPNPIYLYQTWSPDLQAIEYCGFDNLLHEIEFGRDVLKLAQEALSLNEGQGTIPFTDPRQKGLSRVVHYTRVSLQS